MNEWIESKLAWNVFGELSSFDLYIVWCFNKNNLLTVHTICWIESIDLRTSHWLLIAVPFIHSFILETYIAPLQDTTTQRSSHPSHGQRRRTSESCKIWKGGPHPLYTIFMTTAITIFTTTVIAILSITITHLTRHRFCLILISVW